MQRGPRNLSICALTLGTVALLCSTGAAAKTGHQGPAHIPPAAIHHLQPGIRTTPHNEAGMTLHTPPQLTTNPGPGHAATPRQQETDPAGVLHCGQGPGVESTRDDITATIPCLDSSNHPQRLSSQLGLRLGAGSAILGEFDGVRVDYRPTGGLTLNGMAGFQVRSATEKFNPTRQVYGLSAATDLPAREWDLMSYLIGQQVNTTTYSTTLGGALRNRRPGQSLLLFLDYDLVNNSLGAVMASGTWKLFGSATVSATLDLRQRAPNSRQKNYLKNSMSTIENWHWILPEDRLKHHTAGGTGEVSTLAVGWSLPVSPRLRLSGDVALLDAVQEPAADDAAAQESQEFFYHLKLTGKDLLLPGDSSRLELRHSTRDGARISTAAIDSRYTINRDWNITPVVRADYRSDTLDTTPRWVASPSVKMEYRLSKQHGIKIEAGGTWSTGVHGTTNDSHMPYHVSLGYKASF